MVYIEARYKVENYARWRAAFDTAIEQRRANGEFSEQILHLAGDPTDLTVLFKWDDFVNAQRYLESEEHQEFQERSGVCQNPEYRYLERASVCGMTYRELVDELKTLSLEEIRYESDELFEFLIRHEQTVSLGHKLEKFFGLPMKAPGETSGPTIWNNNGRAETVLPNQTLYVSDNEDHSFVGLVWPWANGEIITVKIIKDYKLSPVP